MSVQPNAIESPASTRLVWLAALRVALLSLVMGLVAFVYLGGHVGLGEFSSTYIFSVLVCGFGVTAITLALARRPAPADSLALAHLVVDQAIWTALAYVSGGLASVATTLLALTCVTGAVVARLRGVVVAAVTGSMALIALAEAFAIGAIHPPPDQLWRRYPVTWNDISYPLSINLLAILTVAVLAGYLAERLRVGGEALQEATERADRAERLALLGQLSAGLAHEIRNPLGSIAGSIDLLRMAPEMSEEDRELCDIISREAARLNDLVSDMMDLTKSREPELAPVDLAAIAQDVATLSSQSGRGTDVRVKYAGPHEPFAVEADAGMLRQVLWNLVRNGVQASEPGATVTLTVETGSDEGHAQVWVDDEGEGISDEAKATLFDAFFTTRSKGAGIGLAVVKRVVDSHGWKIDVSTSPGGGARFCVSIEPGLAPISGARRAVA